MSSRTFVYALHIGATPDKLWQALTGNEFWQQYWNGEWRIESDWKVGSPLRFFTAAGEFFSQGEVLESDPPRTLTYTWPNPEEEQGAAPPERLTWRITATGPGTVMLQLVHEQLSEEFYEGVSKGWAAILSSMKTLLETGKPLVFDPKE
jgi:uncharacterized protein YndB with AHSA1/START domain